MSARVILSVKVLHMGMCAVYPVCMLNGLCQIPQLSLWESTEAEPNCQYKPGKLERWGRFCYWYFFSAWPFYNLSTQTSPSCLIWLNWPEQWRLENYCCGFKSQWKKLSRNNPLFYMRIMLKDQTTSFRLFFYQTSQFPCSSDVVQLSNDHHSWQDLAFFLSLSCCWGTPEMISPCVSCICSIT